MASANGATGAPPRRTSPTPQRSCKCEPRSNLSKKRSTRSPARSPTCPAVTATLRWPAAAISNRPYRSHSDSRRRHCLPPCSDTVSDRIGEVACFLGLLTGTLGKVSMDVKLLMQTEVAEVCEPFHEGRGSSSTMPQKRNPISCLYIHATTALVRQQVAALLEAAVADHERSTGPWQIEWIALPEIFLLASGALAQTRLMLFGLEVDADRMRANLDLTRGTIVSEAVMMGLGPYLGRQRAHDLVYDICRKVAASGEPLVEVLARDGDVSRHLTRAQLEKMCDPAAYLGLAGEMVDKVLAREGRPMDR